MSLGRARSAVAGLIGALALVGCGRDPRGEVPGHLEPGSVKHIEDQLRGGRGGGEIERMAMVPYEGYEPPNMAVLRDAVVKYLWVPKQFSGDGESMEFGHWVAIKVRESSFVEEDHINDALFLDSLEEVEITKDGRFIGRALGKPARQERPASDRLGQPWVPAPQQSGPRVTVVVDDGQTSPRVVRDGNVPRQPGTGTDRERWDNYVQDIQARLRASNDGPISPAPPVPAPTPANTTPPPAGNKR